MQIDLTKQSHILFFVVFLPLVSLSIGWLCAQLVPNPPFWLETISPLAAYGILFSLFDNIIWHWPLFRWLGIVSCPDVRGRWLGKQLSSFKDEGGNHITSRVIMEVEQTFSQLHVAMYYYKWRSSISAAQFIRINDTPTMIIMFDADPKADYDGGATAHQGLTKLTQLPDKTLAGTYFNGNGNRGELSFRRTDYKLYRTFGGPGDAPK